MALSNAQLAQQVSELVNYWRTRDQQFAEWLGGTADGGPFGDGRYALTDYLGVIQYLHCPAALEAGVADSASSAAAQAALAGASKDDALIAQAAAEAARDVALTYRNDAQAARDVALQYRDAAANSASIASTHRNRAKAWASNEVDVAVESGLYSALHYATKASESYASLAADLSAATDAAVADATASATASAAAAAQSATDAAGARDITLGYKTDAAGSAADALQAALDAAASAAAAQTWNPNNYLALAGGTMSGALTIQGPNDGSLLTLKSASGTGDANSVWMQFEDAAGALKGYFGDASGGNSDMTMYAATQLTCMSGGSYVQMRSGNGLKFLNAGGSPRGYMYHDGGGFGLLGDPGGWAVYIPSGTNRVEIPGDDFRSDYIYSRSNPGLYMRSNHGSFTYGTMYLGGARNGYVGLALHDGVRTPTFMSSGNARGVYCQATTKWDWYCTDDYMYLSRKPYQDSEGSGGTLLRYVQGQTGGRIWIQQGGSAVGSQEGDITLIW